MITALRNRREQMQLSLKRDHSQQNRWFMLGPRVWVLLQPMKAASVRHGFAAFLLDDGMIVGQPSCNKLGQQAAQPEKLIELQS